MGLVKRLVLALVVLVSLATLGGFLLPRQVRVERATTINAPPATVFTLVNGFKGFNRWSPWFALDPDATYTFEGPDSGVGARLVWKGNPDTLGSGSQEIVESRPDNFVKTRLDLGPRGVATGQFTLAPEGAATRVTWAFDTDLGMNPVSRYMGLLFDRLVGADFEKGLASLKQLAEGLPAADFAGLPVELVDVGPMIVAFIPLTSAADDTQISSRVAAAYKELGRFVARHDLAVSGGPVTINHKWGDEGYVFDVALPVDRAPRDVAPGGAVEPAGAGSDRAAAARDLPAVQIRQLPAGRAARIVHVGPESEMRATYDKLFGWLAAHGHEPNGPPWDEYVREAGDTPDSQLVTNIYVPIK